MAMDRVLEPNILDAPPPRDGLSGKTELFYT